MQLSNSQMSQCICKYSQQYFLVIDGTQALKCLWLTLDSSPDVKISLIAQSF